MNMTKPQTMRRKLRMRILTLTATLLSAVCVMVFCANAVSAQNLRRQMRIQKIQKRIDKKLNPPAGKQNKPSPSNSGYEETITSNEFETTAPKTTPQQIGQSMDGIRQRNLNSLFTQEEKSLWIPGFGNQAALLVIFRQLDLTPEQKVKIREIRRQVKDRLQLTRRDLNQLEIQLEEAIYGNLDPASLESYDPAKVKELTEQVIQKRAEVFRLQTDIESQYRQILTPDQFFVFRGLVRELMRPGSRPLVNPAARQLQEQRRMGVQPNPQSKPDQKNQRNND